MEAVGDQTALKQKSCCKRRTRLEQFLMITIVLALLSIGALIAVLFLVLPKKNLTCSTVSCIKSASILLSNIDWSVDPCENFYQFVCGSYIKTTILGDKDENVNERSKLTAKTKYDLLKIMSTPVSKSDTETFIKVKDLYAACVNTTRITEQGMQPLSEILTKLGGWPIVDGDQWNENSFEWHECVLKATEQGFTASMIFGLGIVRDTNNRNKSVLEIQSGVLTATRGNEYKMEKTPIKYKEQITTTASLLGANESKAKKGAEDIFIVHKKLKSIPTNSSKIKLTIKELQEKYPFISWLQFINRWLMGQSKVTENDRVLVSGYGFMDMLVTVLNELTKRQLANYILWGVTLEALPFLAKIKPEENIKISFLSNVAGDKFNISQQQRAMDAEGMKEDARQRSTDCAEVVLDSLPAPVSAMYIRSYFDAEGKRMVSDMIEGVRESFIEMLRRVKWIDGKTRNHAIRKAQIMKKLVAYPDELLDDKLLDGFSKKVVIDKSNYFKSVLSCKHWQLMNEKSNLEKPLPKHHWTQEQFVSIVNAFYSPKENAIHVPAAILQGVFFRKSRLQALNYGSIGSVLAHEFTHAFDSKGRRFDENGNPRDWWTKKSQDEFSKRAQCIVDQCNSYTDPLSGLKHNGTSTLSENIADNGGATYSYAAYQQWTETHGVEQKLPGLDYSPQQLFWLWLANTRCASTTPKFAIKKIKTSVHALPEYRVVGVLQNSVEFAHDFNCPLGSTMNPKHKCKLW